MLRSYKLERWQAAVRKGCRRIYMEWRSNTPEPDQRQLHSTFDWARIRRVEGREWWLWGYAIAVTLVLTFCICSLTFPGFHLPTDEWHTLNLKEWVRGLAALVLLFDIYTVYQHLQLQRIRRQLAALPNKLPKS